MILGSIPCHIENWDGATSKHSNIELKCFSMETRSLGSFLTPVRWHPLQMWNFNVSMQIHWEGQFASLNPICDVYMRFSSWLMHFCSPRSLTQQTEHFCAFAGFSPLFTIALGSKQHKMCILHWWTWIHIEIAVRLDTLEIRCKCTFCMYFYGGWLFNMEPCGSLSVK